MTKQILPGQTIGIIGGGNVARQLVWAAQKLGYQAGVLTPDHQAPAAVLADWHIKGGLLNEESVRELSERSEVLAFESELVDTDLLGRLRPYVTVPQDPDMVAITQDRVMERILLESLNIHVPPYATITQIADVEEAVQSIGYPCVLKPIQVEDISRKNLLLYSEEDFAKAEILLEGGTCILEAWIPFEKELAITVGAVEGGSLRSFPISETRVRDGKITDILTPAKLGEEMEEEIRRTAEVVAGALSLSGVLTLEFFVTHAGAIYVKKLTMRPHITCAYSSDFCNISQYEMHVRALCGLPLPQVQLIQPCTTHLLYSENQAEAFLQLFHHPNWRFHFYGKPQRWEKGRVGHISIGLQEAEAQEILTQFEELGI